MTGKTCRLFVAEFIGTFAIVFFGAGSVCVNSQFPGCLGLLGISLAFGIVVAVMVSALGHVSGAHFNPAVTLMCLVTSRVSLLLGALYWVAQLSGAAAAALLLRSVLAPEALARVHLGATGIAESLSPMSGLMIEAVLTLFLVLVIFGTAIDKKGHRLGGIAIGGVVCLEILMAGPLTGASMNPARTFGPALLSGFWTHHWIYWVGPFIGAIVGALVYEKVLVPADPSLESAKPQPSGSKEKTVEGARI
jgi:MIP family channel proteins